MKTKISLSFLLILVVGILIFFDQRQSQDCLVRTKQAPVSYPHDSDTLDIISFNGGNFGRTKTPEKCQMLASLFHDSDAILLLEVSTSEEGAWACDRLDQALDQTGESWEYSLSPRTTGASKSECYAVFWKPRRLSVDRGGIHLLQDVESEVAREPFLVPFQINNTSFWVAAYHAVPPDCHPENELRALSGSKELSGLPSVLLAGDFNQNKSGVAAILCDWDVRVEERTTLKRYPDSKGEYRANSYDHVALRGIIVTKTEVLDPVKTSDLSTVRGLSDHLAVRTTVSVPRKR
jgi:hypothetical protein